MIRTLPLRVDPVPGESLSSWVGAVAELHQVGPGELSSIGWPTSALLTYAGRLDTEGLNDADLGAVSAVVSADPDRLRAIWTPMSRYLTRVERAPSHRAMFKPTQASRFCPVCLRESDGRWLNAWRLPWFDACPVHGQRLASVCHRCGGRQRWRALRLTLIPRNGWSCDSPVGIRGRGDARCGADLRDTPAANASQQIVRVVESLTPLLGASEVPLAVMQRASDLANVSRLLHGPARGTAERIDVLQALSEAAGALDDPAAFRALARRDVRKRPAPLPKGLHAPTATLASRLVSERDALLRPVDRLRWGSPALPVAPEPGQDSRALWPHLPAALWNDWALRIFPTSGIEPSTIRLTAPLALVVVGSPEPLQHLTLEPGDRSLAVRLSHALAMVPADQRSGTISGLVQLARRLRWDGSPIDYGRRRRVFDAEDGSAVSLHTADWERICWDGGMSPGGERRAGLARLWLWERLTGGAITHAPQPLAATGAAVDSYRLFLRSLTRITRDLLERHAATLLQDHDIDEPVRWSPPSSWVDGPPVGLDPDGLRVEAITEALREGLAIGDCAGRCGVPPVAITHCLAENPPAIPVSRELPEHVTAEWISERLERGDTLRSLSSMCGVTRKRLSTVLRDAGIAPRIGRTPIAVDPAWLRQQYLELGRTLPHIAEELGTTPTTIARAARAAGIEIRGRGGASHAVAVSPRQDLPDPLGRLVCSQHGLERIRRFQVIAQTPSLQEAARILGVHSSTLTSQVQQLERAVGQPLLARRSKRFEAQRLTDAGRSLLDQVDAHLGPHPNLTQRHPEPLGSALGLYRARFRIGRLAAAAKAPTVRDAANEIGSTPSDLMRLVTRLESGLGAKLVNCDGRDRPLRLTRTGSLLLRQWSGLDITPA